MEQMEKLLLAFQWQNKILEGLLDLTLGCHELVHRNTNHCAHHRVYKGGLRNHLTCASWGMASPGKGSPVGLGKIGRKKDFPGEGDFALENY